MQARRSAFRGRENSSSENGADGSKLGEPCPRATQARVKLPRSPATPKLQHKAGHDHHLKSSKREATTPSTKEDKSVHDTLWKVSVQHH